MSDTLAEWIERWGLSGTDRLVWVARRTIQKEHTRACGLANIHDYTIHDHRHTAAVHLVRVGMPLPILQRQLGHKHIATTMKYAAFHPDYNDVRIYFDRVEANFGLIRGTTSGTTPESESVREEG